MRLAIPQSFRTCVLSLAAMFTLACATCFGTIQDNGESGTEEINFVEQVKPLLEKHCLRCHGPDEEEGALRVDDKDSILDEYFVRPNDSENSVLYEVLVSDDEDYIMPPPEEGQLTAEEIQIIKDWIDQGATWPAGELVFAEPSAETTEPGGSETPSADGQTTEGQEAGGQETEKDSEAEPNFWLLLWENCGVLHPAIIHFPIAMLLGGALFAVLGFRGDSPLGDAAYYCLWLAALSGVLSCVVGWSYAELHPNGARWDDFDMSKTIVQHRWGGILITVLSFIFAFIAMSARRRDPYASGGLWKFGLIFTAALCGYIGHLGGDMTHSGEVEKALKNLGLFQKADPKPAEQQPNENETDDTTGTGKTSDEANDETSEANPNEESGETDGGESEDGGSLEDDGSQDENSGGESESGGTSEPDDG